MTFEQLLCRFGRWVDRHDGLVLAFYLGVFVAVLAASFVFFSESVNLLIWKR